MLHQVLSGKFLVVLFILLLTIQTNVQSAPIPQQTNQNLLVTQVTSLQSVSGHKAIVSLAHAKDGTKRMFLVEKSGRIWILDNTGTRLAEPFLDIRDIIIDTGFEQGLIGLAFDPDYQTNGFFYVGYTSAALEGDSIIARYKVSSQDPNKADPNSATVLLSVEQPSAMHNLGSMAFGPDGYLYIHSGDGGVNGDEVNTIGNGQSLNTLLGKILRIDVRNTNTADGLPYDIPADNPFASDNNPETRGEIWAYGLRNPWAISFDSLTGDLYIADVGQSTEEELNFQAASSTGGENYGWRCREGVVNFNWEAHCETKTFVEPILTYKHDDGNGRCSITGGHVYRGSKHPELVGSYIYGDFCSGEIWSTHKTSNGWETRLLVQSGVRLTAFGTDEDGEIYFADWVNHNVYYLDNASNFVYLPQVLSEASN